MLWRLYFWAYTILTVLGIIFVYGRNSSWAFVDFLEVVTSVIMVFAIYSYVYKKKMFSLRFWDISFKVIVITSLLELLYKFTNFTLLANLLESREVTNGQDVIIGILISLPAYCALYYLSSYHKKQSKK